jgi:hypothetical protein
MNNIRVAPAKLRWLPVCACGVASTISLIGLWMGVGRTKNCDAYVRNSGNEIKEFLGRRLRPKFQLELRLRLRMGRAVSLKRCEAWL